MDYDEEDIPYRSAATTVPSTEDTIQDEQDYSTLVVVQRELAAGLSEIDAIHVFDLTEKSLTIKQQIAAYKKARSILEPIKQRVDSAIESVKLIQEGK